MATHYHHLPITRDSITLTHLLTSAHYHHLPITHISITLTHLLTSAHHDHLPATHTKIFIITLTHLLTSAQHDHLPATHTKIFIITLTHLLTLLLLQLCILVIGTCLGHQLVNTIYLSHTVIIHYHTHATSSSLPSAYHSNYSLSHPHTFSHSLFLVIGPPALHHQLPITHSNYSLSHPRTFSHSFFFSCASWSLGQALATSS